MNSDILKSFNFNETEKIKRKSFQCALWLEGIICTLECDTSCEM